MKAADIVGSRKHKDGLSRKENIIDVLKIKETNKPVKIFGILKMIIKLTEAIYSIRT